MNIDWANLPFGYMKTDFNVRSVYKNGEWSPISVHTEETITMHMASTALHYGQESFEGLKAFRGKDGKIRIFRIEENAKRMQNSAEYIRMIAPSVELFKEAVVKAVQLNEKFVPPYESGASLYIRPLLIGTGAQVGVKPAQEYTFLIFVTPVGPYYKDGFKPIEAIIDRDHDRAAPLGTGHVKVGGNYAASLKSGEEAHKKGFPTVLYLDAKEKKYVDECGAANFFGIKNNTYITPKSNSVLPSITNMSLCTLAEDMELKVERRPIPLTELSEFVEAGNCGTAAVITPLRRVFDAENNKEYVFGNGEPGEWTMKLYKKLRAVQYGDEPDTHNWVTVI